MPSSKSKSHVARAAKVAEGPFYFLTFSSGEPQVDFFAECLQLVFGKHFKQERTPSALVAGESQHDVIVELIKRCAFGVVCLDGLRPNVVFEYGIMTALGIPILPFKEESSKVDIKHFFEEVLQVAAPELKLDKQFSDVKDRHYKGWKRTEIEKTMKTIWSAYVSGCKNMPSYVEIPEPKVW